jgi:hypothetical protein
LRPYFYKNNPKRETEYFESLTDAEKMQILGKDAFAAYQNGDIKNSKYFIGWKNDKRFGRVVYRKSLSQILADKRINIESKPVKETLKKVGLAAFLM